MVGFMWLTLYSSVNCGRGVDEWNTLMEDDLLGNIEPIDDLVADEMVIAATLSIHLV